MTEADSSMGSLPKEAKKGSTPQESQLAAVGELVEVAHARGVDLTGPDGLLKVSTKEVVEFRPNLRRQLSSDPMQTTFVGGVMRQYAGSAGLSVWAALTRAAAESRPHQILRHEALQNVSMTTTLP